MRIATPLLILLFISACQSESVELIVQPKAGESRNLNTTILSTSQQKINDEDIIITSEQTLNLRFLPMSGGENRSSVMETRFDKLGLFVQSKFGEISYETGREPYEDITEYMMSRMTKTPFNVQFRANGSIARIAGINTVISEAFKVVEFNEQEGDAIKGALLLSYGPEALQSHIELITAVLPEGPIRAGDTWTVQHNLRNTVFAKSVSQCVLEKIESDYVLIRTTSEVSPADKNRYANISGTPLRYEVGGTMRGLYRIERKSGWVTHASIDQNFEGVTYGQAEGGELAIPIKISAKIEVSGE
jgi:hypothetical protein